LRNEFWRESDYQDVISTAISSSREHYPRTAFSLRARRQQTVRGSIATATPLTCERCSRKDREKELSIKIIATDGVFLDEGLLAPLAELRALATEHNALLFSLTSLTRPALSAKRGAGSKLKSSASLVKWM